MRRVVTDILLWAPLSVLVGFSWTGHRAYPLWLLLLGLAAWAGAVAVSRRAPVVPLLVVVGLCALDGNYSFGLPLVSYLLGRRMASIWPAAASFSGLALVGTPVVLAQYDFISWATQVGALIYAGLFPWLLGRYRRQQRELLAAGWEQAEQLEREQRILAREVRLRERARIAEDMHDSLGHELSLLALRAGALELTAGLDEQTRAVAGQLRAGAAAATGQLREVVDVLRDDPPAEAPVPPAGESVAELVRRAGAAGMPVELHREEPSEPLPALVDRAVHRVVQEALTNANKHAPGAATTVRLGSDDGGTVLVSVVNARPATGPGSGATTGATTGAMTGIGTKTGTATRTASGIGRGGRGGRGLVGLRERVRLAGGTLHAGERDGGFEVVARLPSRAGRTGPPSPEPTSAVDRRRLVHREARRGLVGAAMVLTTLAVTLGGTALGYYLYATSSSVLSPAAYAGLEVGQNWTVVAPLLPSREALEPPDPDPLPKPAGAQCRYYRSHGDVLQPRFDVYRICAADGRLVAKDVLTSS
ncbi:sensor histidine kinase [Plantactinospora solaniradicis]|uniref:histidine kinase n=1 Tax=Plantactinospora solaniradicis TaxID=1723736 RepID=A0ABW1K3Q2_9ACTN